MVLGHANVRQVLRAPRVFSSNLGATQIRDPEDAEYAVSASFDASGATVMGRRAAALRPQPGLDGRMPDPRTRAGMPDLYAYAHELGEYKRRNPGDDVMSILMQQVDDDGGRVSVQEFENLFWLFSVAGNETLGNGLPGGMLALLAAVLERMGDLELAGEPSRLRSNFQNGLKHLPIRWRPRPAA